jgi:hypothetical protein
MILVFTVNLHMTPFNSKLSFFSILPHVNVTLNIPEDEAR